jgi:hypothetical protein
VGTKVLVRYGHVSAGPLRTCVKVDNSCDSFFIGTLTCIKSIVTVLRAIWPPYSNNSHYWIVSFVLVRTIRSSCIFIKSANQMNLITCLKSHNLTTV